MAKKTKGKEPEEEIELDEADELFEKGEKKVIEEAEKNQKKVLEEDEKLVKEVLEKSEANEKKVMKELMGGD